MKYCELQNQIDDYRKFLIDNFKNDCLAKDTLELIKSSNDINYLDGVINIFNILLEYRAYLLEQSNLYPDILKMVKESKSFDDLRTAHKKLINEQY